MKGPFPSNLHMHTVYADGKNTAEEMLLAAIESGFVSVGFSEHAYTAYDTSYCMSLEQTSAYRCEIRALAQKYSGQIEVYAGLEVDSLHPHDRGGWDYVIGSVHYMRNGETGKYYALDYLPSIFEQAVEDLGDGDAYVLIEKYCAAVATLALNYRPDILAHIDLVAKQNRDLRHFDPNDIRYLSLWEETVRKIAASGCIVELNTGAMSRGYTTEPYPHRNILRMLYAADIPVTISSDAHKASDIAYAFPECIALLRETGYRKVKMMREGRFADFGI